GTAQWNSNGTKGKTRRTAQNLGLILLLPCASLPVRFGNTSTRGPGTSNASSRPAKSKGGSSPSSIRGEITCTGSSPRALHDRKRGFDDHSQDSRTGRSRARLRRSDEERWYNRL